MGVLSYGPTEAGEDTGRIGWAVTHQAWGSGIASCTDEGMGVLVRGYSLQLASGGQWVSAWSRGSPQPLAYGSGPAVGLTGRCFLS